MKRLYPSLDSLADQPAATNYRQTDSHRQSSESIDGFHDCSKDLSVDTPTLNTRDPSSDHCPLCNQTFENLAEHVQKCLAEDDRKNDERRGATSIPQNDVQSASASSKKSTRDCIWCFKAVPEKDYAAHVQTCIPQSPDDLDMQTSNERMMKDSCLNCASTINSKDGTAFIIPCPSRHVY
ncbi:unnamed protein product, partial [Adineta ricciae]